jgi:hypothetical protein
VVTRQWTGQAHRQVTMLNARQFHVLRLLGYEPSIDAIRRRSSGRYRGNSRMSGADYGEAQYAHRKPT